ncbi:MAG: 5-formyltetrahydrofolate cyclo-ligase [Peptococcaceae bacterium]|jgi:5-formyltetrahydrofolate cyclo-ligase|nr:5-formyltetrahydrofolate cyclo-ligase [Peptococcaceae bacterium]
MTEDKTSLLKKKIRTAVLERRSALSEEERRQKSELIRRRVTALPEYRQSRTIMLFLNFNDEVDTSLLAADVLADGKTLVLPRCAPEKVLIPAVVHDLNGDVGPGVWGIREPLAERTAVIEPTALDLVIVPGVAFDVRGRRLGYGGGYYDRFLPRLSRNTPLWGMAFACQMVEQVPAAAHDQAVSLLVTERAVIRCGG